MGRTEVARPSFWTRIRGWWGTSELGKGPLALFLVVPAATFLVAIIAYPVLHALYLSTRDVSLKGLATGVMPFVGLENYGALFRDPTFWKTMMHSAEFVIMAVSLEITLGMGIALIINNRSTPVLGKINKALMLVPWAVPAIANGLMWGIIYNPSFGYLNVVLMKLGIIDSFMQFAGNPDLAMFSVVVAYVWRVTPFSILLFHAALQGIPEELYDAAKVDGAGWLQQYRYITFALIRPTLTIVLVLRTAFAFMVFDEIFAPPAAPATGPGWPPGIRTSMPSSTWRLAWARPRPT